VAKKMERRIDSVLKYALVGGRRRGGGLCRPVFAGSNRQ
jgi:hypothetical protein